MHKNTSKKGFTLVEIMIVVVIIGLLAAMAIPAFQRVRESSRASAMDNDARQLASAAQQYMLENNTTSASITYAAATGVITGDLAAYVRQVGKSYTLATAITAGGTFSVGHPQANPTTRTYSAEGQAE